VRGLDAYLMRALHGDDGDDAGARGNVQRSVSPFPELNPPSIQRFA
jgi:hypothetical protein